MNDGAVPTVEASDGICYSHTLCKLRLVDPNIVLFKPEIGIGCEKGGQCRFLMASSTARIMPLLRNPASIRSSAATRPTSSTASCSATSIALAARSRIAHGVSRARERSLMNTIHRYVPTRRIRRSPVLI